MESQSRSRWIYLIAVAMAIYVVLAMTDQFVAVPLREASAAIAAGLIDWLGLSIERNGTILNTEHFSFDVVPACSGSTTLRVLLAAGIIWCGAHPRLNWGGRIFCVASAVPVALVSNGVRVGTLVLLGDYFLEPVKGVAHTAVGLASFLLAMATVYLLTEVSAVAKTKNGGSKHLNVLLLFGCLGILYWPTLLWIANAWKNSVLDSFGVVCVLISLLGIYPLCRGSARGQRRPGLAVVMFAAGMIVLTVGNLVDVNLVKAVSLLCLIESFLLALSGFRAAVVGIIPCAIFYLGLPTVTYQITLVTSAVADMGGQALSLGAKAVLLLCLLAAERLAWMKWIAGGTGRIEERANAEAVERQWQPRLGRWQWAVNTCLLIAVASCVAHVSIVNAGRGEPGSVVKLSFLQGEWVGRKNRVSDQTRALLGDVQLISREYSKEEEKVNLILTSTGGNRHNAHPPEYCMVGAGWRIARKSTSDYRINHEHVKVSRLLLKREDRELVFVYWFSDGKARRASYSGMLKTDILRRLQGKETNWFVFRVMARDEEAVKSFLREMKPQFVTKETDSDGSLDLVAGRAPAVGEGDRGEREE